jgi:hypothetical protein
MNSKTSDSGALTTSSPEANAAKASGTDGGGPEMHQDALNPGAVTPEERNARIAIAAYRLAGSRGFEPGGELEDWLRAEREAGDTTQAANAH